MATIQITPLEFQVWRAIENSPSAAFRPNIFENEIVNSLIADHKLLFEWKQKKKQKKTKIKWMKTIYNVSTVFIAALQPQYENNNLYLLLLQRNDGKKWNNINLDETVRPAIKY